MAHIDTDDMTSIRLEHIRRVRLLYKTILRVHRGLPTELQSLGDQYVKDEFRRHKDADSHFIPVFMTEWTNYAMTIAKQLRHQTKDPSGLLFGSPLTEENYMAMSDEQISQLYELFQESNKPRDCTDPLGVKSHPAVSQSKDPD